MRTINHMKFPVPRLSVLAIALASVGMGYAQTQTNVPVLKEVVVVSAARYEQLQDDLPLTMDVVGVKELEEKQIGDIKDLVADMPNVSVKHAPARFRVAGQPSSTGRDGNSGFNIRGLGGNRVLMLADGIRLPRSYANGNTSFGRDTLSLDLLKRVEIIRGPSSVLYGSDGIAGLVNFITYEPSDFLEGEGEEPRTLGGRFSAGWSGDDEGLTSALTLAGRASETTDWLITATARTAHALDNMGTNDSPNTTRTRPNPQSDRAGSLLGKLVYRPDGVQKHIVTLEHVDKSSSVELLSSRGSTVRLTNPVVAAAVISQESGNENQIRNRLTWDANYRISSAWADHLQTVLSLQNADAHDNGLTLVAVTPQVTRTRDTTYAEHAWQGGIKAEKTVPLGQDWSQRLSYGLDHAQTNVTSWFGGADSPANRFSLPFVPKKYFPDTRDTTDAVFLQSEIGNERWIITPGIRWEQFAIDVTSQDGYGQAVTSLSGAQWTPKVGAIYRLQTDWSVFANYATGFRAPNATQLNGFSEATSTGYATYLSNPDLKPETSKNLELGLRGRTGRLSFNASVFSGDFSQLIVDKKLLSGNPASCGAVAPGCVYQSVNVDNATIWGGELSGSMDWGYWADGRWSTPFAYGQARGRDNGTGKPLNSIDPAMATLGLSYATQSWSARMDLHYHAAKSAADVDPIAGLSSGTQYADMPEATTLDVSAQWRLRKNVRINASIVNLTDRKYWLWSDVQGLTTASAATLLDAYTQPGRHANVSLVVDF
jgi:hemoglobin/transferrin/lactoferrin receptor protein